jgi:hypothetical protein
MTRSVAARLAVWVRPADLAVASFLVPALLLVVLSGPLALGATVAGLGTAAAILGRRAGRTELRLPGAILAVAGPAFLAPAGLFEVLLAGLGGLGVLTWLSTISGAPMGPGRRLAGLSVPAVGLGMVVAVAFATPGLAGGPAFAALLVVLAVFVAAYGVLGGGPEKPTAASPLGEFEESATA